MNYTRPALPFMHGNAGGGNAREGIWYNAPLTGEAPRDMHVLINGKSTHLAEGTKVADLVRDLGLADRRIAVELNGEILPRSRHMSQVLVEGDALEIVHAIGGGSAIENHRGGSAIGTKRQV